MTLLLEMMKTILVIEDEREVRENVAEILELEDFNVITAEDGSIGVQLARKYHPDLILCDIMMPQMDGYGAIAELRQQDATATIPFIFITAKAERHDLRRGMELGAHDYLTKPFTPSELRNAVVAQLSKRAVLEDRMNHKLDRLRSGIARALPHELRTPLNAIIGCSDLLLTDYNDFNPAEIWDMLRDIHGAGLTLYRTIENFLLYAELDLANVDPNRLRTFCNGARSPAKAIVAETSQAVARRVGRTADLHLELSEAVVAIDRAWLQKMVEEIVDNAFKFSAPSTPIQLTSLVREHWFRISVRDRGRGMTTEQIASLEAYVQFERKLYEQQGMGIGLAIVQRLARLHSGSLSLESVPGESTLVCLSLPLAQATDDFNPVCRSR